MPNTAKKPGKKDIKFLIDSLLTASGRKLIDLLHIDTEETYQEALEMMKFLMMNIPPETEENAMGRFMALLAKAIEQYETRNFPAATASPVDVLHFLMEQHGLRQCDLPEIGNQAKVSEILNGKRELNLRQVKALSERFGLSPAVFIA